MQRRTRVNASSQAAAQGTSTHAHTTCSCVYLRAIPRMLVPVPGWALRVPPTPPELVTTAELVDTCGTVEAVDTVERVKTAETCGTPRMVDTCGALGTVGTVDLSTAAEPPAGGTKCPTVAVGHGGKLAELVGSTRARPRAVTA